MDSAWSSLRIHISYAVNLDALFAIHLYNSQARAVSDVVVIVISELGQLAQLGQLGKLACRVISQMRACYWWMDARTLSVTVKYICVCCCIAYFSCTRNNPYCSKILFFNYIHLFHKKLRL